MDTSENIKIATFVGYEVTYESIGNMLIPTVIVDGQKNHFEAWARFHDSWEWIMPVWISLLSRPNVKGFTTNDEVALEIKNGEKSVFISNGITKCKTLFDCYYRTILEAIHALS